MKQSREQSTPSRASRAASLRPKGSAPSWASRAACPPMRRTGGRSLHPSRRSAPGTPPSAPEPWQRSAPARLRPDTKQTCAPLPPQIKSGYSIHDLPIGCNRSGTNPDGVEGPAGRNNPILQRPPVFYQCLFFFAQGLPKIFLTVVSPLPPNGYNRTVPKKHCNRAREAQDKRGIIV